MKVFAIKASGIYGGGMSIVAADSEDDAKKLAQDAEHSPWHVHYANPQEIEELSPALVWHMPKSRVIVSYETGE